MNRKKEVKLRNTKPKNDLTGLQFGYLIPQYWIKGRGWNCKCKCGKETIVSTHYLLSGHTQSCGCKRYETKNIINMLGYENDYYKVIGQEQKIKGKYPRWICECKNCGRKFLLDGSSIRNYDLHSCGCIHSLGEQKIIKLLEDNHVNYSKEFTFNDLLGVNGGRLRFDFAIFTEDNKLKKLIEFNGEQHYVEPKGSWKTNFEILKEHDRRKVAYCEKNNIDLKIIKFDTEFDISDLI